MFLRLFVSKVHSEIKLSSSYFVFLEILFYFYFLIRNQKSSWTGIGGNWISSILFLDTVSKTLFSVSKGFHFEDILQDAPASQRLRPLGLLFCVIFDQEDKSLISLVLFEFYHLFISLVNFSLDFWFWSNMCFPLWIPFRWTVPFSIIESTRKDKKKKKKR